LPLIPRITTNKFLLILLYKGHAIKKTCDDIVMTLSQKSMIF
jgi:hypothetical protein